MKLNRDGIQFRAASGGSARIGRTRSRPIASWPATYPNKVLHES